MIFQLLKLGTSVIHHSHVILTGKSISKRSSSRSKCQIRGQVRENNIFNK